MPITFNRRRLLETFGMGGAAYFLPSLRPAHAATPPQRVVIFYSHQGTLPWMWKPTGTRTDFKLGPLLEPLDPYKKDLILFDGVDFKALELPNGKGGSDGHATTQACSMTANVQINHLTNDPKSRGKGPSFDWFLGRKLEAANGGRPPTPFGEQRFRVYDRLGDNPNWYRPLEDDKNQWLLPSVDPGRSFDTLFGAAMQMSAGGDTADNARILQRKSALDFAVGEFGRVANKVGTFEKQRLDQHAEIVRGIEKQLQTRADSAKSCTAPPRPQGARSSAGNWDFSWKGFSDLAVAALTCDLSRVVFIHVDEVAPKLYGGINSASLGGIDNLHDLVHAINVGSKDNQDANRLKTVKGYYGAHTPVFKELLDKLAAVKESDGKRLLDHTAVLWCGELPQPGHSPHNNKWLTAGSCGGKLKTGQWLNYDGDGIVFGGVRNNVPSNGDVFTTLAKAMGVNESFGAPGATKGPISDALV